MKFQRRIGSSNVVVSCYETLAAQAEALLEKLAELDGLGPPLGDGTTVQFGWSRLTLRVEAEDLVVCEPAFEAEEADSSLTPSVDDTLVVLLEQTELMRKLGTERATHVDYRQRVVVASGVLDCPHIYMLRQEPTGPDDSGWFIGDAEDPDRSSAADHLESLRVHQLVRHTHLMSALILPTGTSVVFLGGMLETVTDANNHEIFTIH